jgi:hypothetical protein
MERGPEAKNVRWTGISENPAIAIAPSQFILMWDRFDRFA